MSSDDQKSPTIRFPPNIARLPIENMNESHINVLHLHFSAIRRLRGNTQLFFRDGAATADDGEFYTR